jgi:adenylate cyclase
MGYQPIVREAERSFSLASSSLWDLLANTDHLDRSIGLPHVAFGPLTVTADAFYREATARFWRVLRLTWREYPFEWVRGQRYAVLRLFESGPLTAFYGGVEVTAEDQRSRLRVFAEFTPRTPLGWAMARVLARKGIRDIFAYCQRFVALRMSSRDIGLPPSPQVSPVNRLMLDRMSEALQRETVGAALVARFVRHLATASDTEVLRMQPYGLADAWGADRPEMLRLLVGAERQGALHQTWEVMCPNCRVPTVRSSTLAGVPERFHCDTCGIAYDTDLERWVELRYSVTTQLRPAKDEVYCIGGPANAPHIWAQHYMLPGTERTFSLTLPEEALRVRALRVNLVCPLEPDDAATGDATFTYRQDGWFQIRQGFRPGLVTVRLRNEAPHVAVVVLERVQPDPRAITAAQVLREPELLGIPGNDGARPGRPNSSVEARPSRG